MKKRVFQNLVDSKFVVVIFTHDWSEGDTVLMGQFGEPEINVGGVVEYIMDGEVVCKEFGDEFVRVLHGFPYRRVFDSRDYSSVEEAMLVGKAWKDLVLSRIDSAVEDLRNKRVVMPTEEVSEI